MRIKVAKYLYFDFYKYFDTQNVYEQEFFIPLTNYYRLSIHHTNAIKKIKTQIMIMPI